MHFYEFNIGDYAKKTQHLTNEEDLAYRRLLDMYYDTENPVLTTGLATLSRRLRVSENALKNVLDEFFPDGKNKHAEEKIADYHEYLKRQKANGSKGGRPKHKPVANPALTQNNPAPSQTLTTKPLTTNQNNKPSCASPSAEYSADFELAWAAYPRREGASKKDAFKAWAARLKAGVLPSVMIDGVTRYAAYCKAQGTEQRYIKQPVTFFGTGEHYLTSWSAIPASNRNTPTVENFESKNYGEGITTL